MPKPVKAITVKIYECSKCSATTKSYLPPPQCHFCYDKGVMNLQELPKPLDKDPDLLVGSPAWLKTFEDKVMAAGSRAWMADKMTEIFSELQVMRECGQKEYAHDEQDAFANFRRIGKELEIPMEKVLMVYLLKHKDGVVAHINGHVSQREDVRGRLKDWMVYICLLWGMFDAA